MSVAVGWKGLPTYVLAEAGLERADDGTVRVPYRLRDGRVWGLRVFAGNGRAWWASSDETGTVRPGLNGQRIAAPFGVDRQWPEELRRYRLLAICEGESDCLALDAALGTEGFDCIAAPGASVWRAEWAEYAAGYVRVYVFPDGDDAGRRFVERVIASVPQAVAVWLPAGEDVRAMIQGGRLAELVALIEERDRLEEFLCSPVPRERRRRAA